MERYIFRSQKRECHIPVQLQLMKDEEFLAESLASSGTGQVFDYEHSDDSTSDIDILALLNHSDQKLSSPIVNFGKTAGAGGSGLVSGGPGSGSADSVSQSDINQTILAQLNSLDEQLGSMEKTFGKRKLVTCQRSRPLHLKQNVTSVWKYFVTIGMWWMFVFWAKPEIPY